MELFREYLHEELSADGHMSNYTLSCPDGFNFAYDVVDRIAGEEPDRLALYWNNVAGDTKRFTFGEMKEQSDKAAAYLESQGIKRGDKVLLILKRHWQYWPILLALHKLGAIAVPATHQLKADDIIYRLRAASIKAVIATYEDGTPANIDAGALDYEFPLKRFLVHGAAEGWESLDAGVEVATGFAPKEGKDRAGGSDQMILYFTSGTTAEPKMVAHDYTYPIAHIPTAYYWQHVDPNGLHLTVSDSGWAKSSWGKIYGQWLLGAGIYVYDFDRFVPKDLLQRLQDDGVTTLCAAPTIYRFLIHEDLQAYDLSKIKHATTAGEPLNPEVSRRFKEATGLTLHEAFGQTETTPILMTPWWIESKPASMGKASPTYDVYLLDNEGKQVPPNTLGEICIKADPDLPQIGLFKGYYQEPALTARGWYNGFYHTGDLATYDEDGYYYYDSRMDDVIKSSGYRIGPFEVESVIMKHPSVLECAVTGVPDPIRGTVVKATIVLVHEYEASTELAKEIQDYVKANTAPYKYPRQIEFVEELPKTISGKIRRVEIRERDRQQELRED